VIEVELNGFGADIADDGHIFTAIIHGDLDLGANFQRNLGRKFSARDIDEILRFQFAVTIGGQNGNLLAIADFQAGQFAFQTGDDVSMSLQEGNRAVFFG
jgi:hypothetical protein